MKILGIIMTTAVAGGVTAIAESDPPPETPAPVQWTMEGPPVGEGAIVRDDTWMEARHGVAGQFLDAPNPLAPLNPLAPVRPEFKESTLSRDTMTGRAMGLTLLRVEF